MAKLLLAKSYYKFPTIWQDPDTNNNRIFLDNYGYDFTTLAPRFMEQFYWQGRFNNANNSSAVDFDPWAPIQMADGLDGTAYADGNGSIWNVPGLFNLWIASIDYKNYKPTRIFKSRGGRIVAIMPASGTTSDQFGTWWSGNDMIKRGLSNRFDNTFFYCHCWEHEENISFNASSWSYSGTTITINQNNHGFVVGDTITVTGATSTTFAPNGIFIVNTVPGVNSFTYIVGNTPTGTAGGTTTVTGKTWRAYGIEPERSTINGARTTLMTRHNYTFDDNISDANSRPSYTSLNTGGWKFFLGVDPSYVWFASIATGTTGAISIQKYLLAGGTGVETSVLGATAPTSAASGVLNVLTSGLRTTWGDVNRKVFYTGHYNATQHAPLRIVWTTSTGAIASTECSITFPAGTSYTTYSTYPTANSYDTGGYSVFWCKPHQFVEQGTTNTNLLTMCNSDAYIYSNTARFPTLKSRTWLTYNIGNGTSDQNLTFHSGIFFNTTNDFPLAWVPYAENTTTNKVAVFSNNGTSILTWNSSTFTAASWTYNTTNNVTLVTVTQPNHNLIVGNIITTSGASTASNPPNGIYKVNEVTSSTFNFIVNANNSGVPTGATTGNMLVKMGWQYSVTSPVRARGYSVDRLGRLWVTTRTPALGRVEIHMISDTTPATISITLDNAVTGTTGRYVYTGSNINTFLNVDAYDSSGQRLVSTLTLTITGNSMTFSGNATSTQITTSAASTTQVAVTISGAGQTSVNATVNI